MVSERICAMHFMGMQAVDGHSPNSIILLDAKFKTYARRVDSRLLGISFQIKPLRRKFAC